MVKKYMDMIKNYVDTVDLHNKVKGFVTSRLLIFLIAGIIISFIFFSILSFLFKTPFIIVVGLLIGYSLFKMYEKYESFRNRY